METRDFQAIAVLGSALWANPESARVHTTDVVATAALRQLTRDRRVESAARALLETATRGDDPNAEHKHEPFYRLSPEERLTLAALYHGHWSYERLSRVLGLTVDQVQELAWGARLDLATGPTGRSFVPHPVGSRGPSCPEYLTQRPWTQKFFDEEMTPRERAFIQAHAEGCASCQQALNRARQLYYSIQAMVPAPQEASRLVYALGDTFNEAAKYLERDRLTFVDSLVPLLRRWDVRALLAAVFLFLVSAMLAGS